MTLEIEAEVPAGAPDHLVRTVTENSRTLKLRARALKKNKLRTAAPRDVGSETQVAGRQLRGPHPKPRAWRAPPACVAVQRPLRGPR